jgi:hypothetical protein
MPKKRSYSKRGDTQGHISCKCKTAYSGSPFEVTNISTNKSLKKSSSKKVYARTSYPHQYKVEKGSRLSIGTMLNGCKCTLFSGKARGGQFRPNRKDPSYVRARQLKNVNGVNVDFV